MRVLLSHSVDRDVKARLRITITLVTVMALMAFAGYGALATFNAETTNPTNTFATGTRVLSGLTGIAITNGTATCTVSVAGLTNTATSRLARMHELKKLRPQHLHDGGEANIEERLLRAELQT